MREYAVIFEKTSTGWSAYVPDLPGLGVAGPTYEATEQLIREGIAFHIEGLQADGEPIPEPTTRVTSASSSRNSPLVRETAAPSAPLSACAVTSKLQSPNLKTTCPLSARCGASVWARPRRSTLRTRARISRGSNGLVM